MEICPKCGLPKEACVCEVIAKSEQKIRVELVKKRYGKVSTMVTGIDPKDVDLKSIAKELKNELACGGTVKNNEIELQGDHAKKVREKLVSLGFAQDSIE
jgi:translation initiation factor 1